MKQLLILLSLIISISSCTPTSKKETTKEGKQKTSVRHARGFTIRYFDHYTEVTVRNPWDTTKTLEKYILVDRNKPTPNDLPKGTLVKIPVQKAAVCSVVHIGIWKLLGKINNVVAVCQPKYISFPEIKKGLASGKVFDLGQSTSIDLEKLIASTPEILVVSPYENSSYGRLAKTGIPVVEDASYMEDSPLGRAEWIKFEATFTGQEVLAEKIFTQIENRYQKLCDMVSNTKERPTVFTEKKYGQVWYVPGGKSYIGRFLKDAGANYLWSDYPQSGSVPLSFEAVYARAEKAKFWLIKYNNPQENLTYTQLQNDYELYQNFDAFKDKHIFAVNSANTPYYEEGPMEPEVILADMVSIFHPELMPGHKAKYYFGIK